MIESLIVYHNRLVVFAPIIPPVVVSSLLPAACVRGEDGRQQRNLPPERERPDRHVTLKHIYSFRYGLSE